ncbi:MAG: hypothetical protein KGO96_09225 [Elusimicrobia bacterium]|nr:hypothetical protein [Elusimicrobiota bacterium]MDE2236428.1 hypothetical protein [Elusimicrobiota bacterium]MDE2426070.1 hypothetical protein [Elusimicrobiota bacterium]
MKSTTLLAAALLAALCGPAAAKLKERRQNLEGGKILLIEKSDASRGRPDFILAEWFIVRTPNEAEALQKLPPNKLRLLRGATPLPLPKKPFFKIMTLHQVALEGSRVDRTYLEAKHALDPDPPTGHRADIVDVRFIVHHFE